MTPVDPVFAIAATIAVFSSLMMVTRGNPVYSAVWLLATFLSVAVLFLTLTAPFLAAVHILVYTGAILVLFLFVIMLLNLKPEEFGEEYPLPIRLAGAAGCAALFAAIAVPIVQSPSLWVTLGSITTTRNPGTVEAVGDVLFRGYGLQFELVSVLIIVAMFGAMILAKKRLWQ